MKSSDHLEIPDYPKKSAGQNQIFLDWAGDVWYQRTLEYNDIEDEYISIQRNFTEDPEASWKILRDAVEKTRERIARLVNSPKSRRIIHTTGTMDGIMQVMMGFLSHADQVVTTDSEFSTLYNLLTTSCSSEPGNSDDSRIYDVRIAKIREIEVVDEIVERIADLVTLDTKMLIVSHVSQSTGVLLPIKEIIAEVKRKNPMVLVLVDGAQAVGHVGVDVCQSDCDFYSADFHKWVQGPNNTGFLYVRDPGHAQALSRFCFNPMKYAPEFDMENKVCSKSGLIVCSTAVVGHLLKKFLTPEVREILDRHNNSLSSEFSDMIDHHSPLAIRRISPRDEGLMTGIISFTFDRSEIEHLCKKLQRNGIRTSAQFPVIDDSIRQNINPVSFLRFSFSDLWNEREDVKLAFESFRDMVS